MGAPGSLIVAAHWNTAIDLDYVRDGASVAPSATYGTPTVVAGGKFNGGLELGNPANPDGAEWNGAGLVDAMVQAGCVSLWLKPGYTGAPGAQQNIFFTNTPTSFVNRVSIWHTSSGMLQAYINNSAGSLIAGLSSAWSPTSGQWYHIELNFDVTAGASRLFVDGTQLGATSAGTGTRSSTATRMIVGGTNTAPGANSNFVADELLVFDAVRHTATFTPATEELDLTPPVSELYNLSFETPLTEDGAAYISVPGTWQETTSAAGSKAATFGPPLRWAESFEAQWSDNHLALATLDGSLTILVFNTDDPNEDNHRNEEGYERGWSGNEGIIGALEPTGLSVAGFNDDVDSAEDYETQWPKRHAVNDTRRVDDDELVDDGDPPKVYALLNGARATYEAHRQDGTVHATADTTNAVTAPDCGDPVSAVALANDLWDTAWDHLVDAGDTYHTPDTRAAMVQPPIAVYPAATLADAAAVANWLFVYLNAHFTWLDNGGSLALSAYRDTMVAGSEVYSYAVPAAVSPEDYESGWRGNEGAVGALTPGMLTAFAFTTATGPTSAETYDDAQALLAAPAVDEYSAPEVLGPTGTAELYISGTVTGLVLEVQTTRGPSATFVTRDTVTALPATVPLAVGSTAVRLYTQALTSGSAAAVLQWRAIDTLL